MPKMKSHSGTKKRIKVTGSGKYLRRQAGRGHNRLAKGKSTFRRRALEVEVSPGAERTIKKLLES